MNKQIAVREMYHLQNKRKYEDCDVRLKYAHPGIASHRIGNIEMITSNEFAVYRYADDLLITITAGNRLLVWMSL